MIGKTLSHYRILEKIGAGGMGEVYRAEDSRLGRLVALKVLPDEVAADPDRLARFEREARTVAALSHPNILVIHDFGSEGGITYAVMEHLEGETLRHEMDRIGSLPASSVRERAAQIARGLAAAHDRGVVHRDLKPENLFVTRDGTMKILDFGLATVAAPSVKELPGATTLANQTVPGAMLGTPAYMSPEQVRGRPADPRSDVFAFGVVLYEMLTGRNPFRRDSLIETMNAILHENPRPVTSSAPGAPADLSRIALHCLEKNPGQRPVSAREIAQELDSPLARPAPSVATAEEIDSLAVLPFRNESGDDDAEYLSDGITDMLIDNLSQIPRLKVMARSTVFRYRGQEMGPLEVGPELGVRAVLTGRLLRRSGEVVVRTELVDVTDGRRLWGGRFHRPVADLLAIEEEISREISENLRLRITGEEKERLARRPTDNPEAQEQYLRGRHVWNRWKTPEGMRMAIGFFERALALDPLHARALAGLADSWSVLGNIKALPPGEAYPAARTAAEQGLAIDDSLGELHTSLGFILFHWDWDWAAAEREYGRALELNPGYSTAHRWYGGLLSSLGRHDEAMASGRRALELDPLSPIIHTAVGDIYFYARRYDEAMDYYRRSLELDPQLLAGHTDLARTLELAGRFAEAIAEYEIGAALAPKGPPEPSSGLAHVYAHTGRREDAREIVRQLLELSARRYVSPYGIASIHASLGENEAALDWLEKAFAEHDQTLVLLKVHPRLDGLRNEPRYRELLRRMKLD